jgi:preprotein translocase subunit SecD
VLQQPGRSYTVALNLLPASPEWLTSIGALPMYLGLDLRGGVHFLLQVDMPKALDKAAERYQGDIRTLLREKKVRYTGIGREGQMVYICTSGTRPSGTRRARPSRPPIRTCNWVTARVARNSALTGTLKKQAQVKTQEDALKQNLTTLRNRVNELGVAEPVIQQQGIDRVVVQLPGVQDTAKAKEILGRTATLEIRMVDEEKMQDAAPSRPPWPARRPSAPRSIWSATACRCW